MQQNRLDELKDAFYAAIGDNPVVGHPDPAIGEVSASKASDCGRYLWLTSHGYRPQRGSGDDMLQAQRGFMQEPFIRNWLEKAGVKVIEQERAVYFLDAEGKYKLTGQTDNLIEWPDGQQAVIDYKLMSARSYLEWLRDGLLTAHENYYAQLQWYMALHGVKDAVLFGLAASPADVRSVIWQKQWADIKDADATCSMEWIEFDEGYIAESEQRLVGILSSPEPADRSHDAKHITGNKYEHWRCNPRWCGLRETCLSIGACKDVNCGHKQCETERMAQAFNDEVLV